MTIPGQLIISVYAKSPAECLSWMEAIQLSLVPPETRSIANYDIMAVIGRGMYGKVLLVKKKGTNEFYAIKAFHKSQLVSSNNCHTIISERNILMRAKNPFIVQLKFAFQTDRKFYLGLEYVGGGDLFHHIEQVGAMSIDKARLYVAEIAIALDYLHSIGVVYRDLKPENVLLDAQGHIKLTDFGLSKDIEPGEKAETLCGTPEYLAPELVCKKQLSNAVDWWALGCLMFELLTARTAFFGETTKELLEAIIKTNPQMDLVWNADAVSLINGLLMKDPSERMGFEAVKAHPFFGTLDWRMVSNKEYKPEFVPPRDGQTTAVCFDKDLRREPPTDSKGLSAPGASFLGFSFDQDALL